MTAPILIYGPTASGKSSVSLTLADQLGGAIVNADALQVYAQWSVLSARPDAEDLAQAPHFLYGHVAATSAYSVGTWLSEVSQLLSTLELRPIIVGGTGLYLSTLITGLAHVPPIPSEVRARGNALRESKGAEGFVELLHDLDPVILERIDLRNAMRLQRAWEVATATGQPLSQWQAETPAPLIAPHDAQLICLNASPDWQRHRIDLRFDQMVENGALDECRAVLDAGWDPELPSSQAIGAAELIGYLVGKHGLDEAKALAKISTHQFAKRQLTWAKNRMKTWDWFDSDKEGLDLDILEHIETEDRKRRKNS